MKKPVYQVIHIEQRPSKLNGGYYYHIKLQDIKTHEVYETSVDPAYRNYSNWSDIIKDQGFGQLISNVSIVVKGNKSIINADSKPTQEIVCERQALLDQLDQWRDPNRFKDLFE